MDKVEDLKVWDKLFKDIETCGEKDFSNFVKEFNILLTPEDRHKSMMFMIDKISKLRKILMYEVVSNLDKIKENKCKK